jgi:two-component system response regulator
MARILVVEDNPDDEMLILRALKKCDVTEIVDVARDGEQAMDYIRALGVDNLGQASKNPDLIILDLKLPKVEGLTVLECIRHNKYLKRTPVVIMTSSDEKIDKIKSYDLGANSYIRKPIDFETFCSTVNDIHNYWLNLNEGLQAG